MARVAQNEITDPTQCVLQRANVYLQAKKYPMVILFSKYPLELDRIQRMYGGKVYKHGTGWNWVVARRQDQLALVAALGELLTPQMKLHKIVALLNKQNESQPA